MTTSSTEIKSLYIPYIRTERDADFVTEIFESHGIGIVERVDFFENTQVENGWAKSAFVHLSRWFYNDFTNDIYNSISAQGGGGWKFQVYNPYGEPIEFWNLRQMTSPKIPDTQLNIHQLAAKMADMQSEIDELNEIISSHDDEDCDRGPPWCMADLNTDYVDDDAMSISELDTDYDYDEQCQNEPRYLSSMFENVSVGRAVTDEERTLILASYDHDAMMHVDNEPTTVYDLTSYTDDTPGIYLDQIRKDVEDEIGSNGSGGSVEARRLVSADICGNI